MALDMERISGEQFRNVIQIMNPCMDDYLYILDLKDQKYYSHLEQLLISYYH